MGRSATRPPALKTYLALNAAALLGAAVLMGLVAPGSLSPFRLLLIAVTVALAIACAGFVTLLHRQPARERRLAGALQSGGGRLKLALAALFIILWCLTWIPPHRTGDAYYYFIGIYPLILCGLLASGGALVLLSFPAGSSSLAWWGRYFRERRPAVRATIAALAAFALVAVLTTQLQILRGAEPYWFGAGVPILAAQVLAALLVAALALRLETWSGTPRIPVDVVLFLVVWVVAAILWAARAVPPSYWITGPQPPNFESYPFSDSITYDLGSQFALIGQGIYNRMFIDRALYMSFLVYLHTLGGQNYQAIMSIQAAIFAVFPALLFLIGKRLHSLTAGLTLAALIIVRGLGSLDASAWIDTATFKHMMTDFPTAIGVAGFLVLALKWLENPRENLSSLIWAGGVLGLTSLLRPHVMLLMAAAALLALWLMRTEWRRAVGITALASLAFLMAVLPWLVLGPSSGSLISQYGQRVQAVIAQRYPALVPTLSPAPPAAPALRMTQPAPSSPAAAPTPPATPVDAAPPAAPAEDVPPENPAPIVPPADPGVPFIVDHLLHNLVTSALVFPVTPEFLSVREVVKDGEAFWRPRWGGAMTALSAWMLALNLMIVAFGIGAAFQRDRLRGLVPIVVLLLYLSANALARTSGGRYVVPVDWIVVAYYCVGLAELVHATRAFVRGRATVTPGMPTGRSARTQRPATRAGAGSAHVAARPLTILVSVLILGALVPLAGVLHPRRYAPVDDMVLLQRVQSREVQSARTQDVAAFLQQPGAVVVQGRALYPLFYRQGQGEPTRYAPYHPREYPRLVFVLIGPQGMQHVMLAASGPQVIPNAADVTVLGCRLREAGYDMIQALVVTVEGPDQQSALERDPAASLRCPLPEPVCDDNGNCF